METYDLYFKPDVDQCGGDTLFFICSLQFPKCEDNVKKKPCKRLCEGILLSNDIAALIFKIYSLVGNIKMIW